MSEEVLAAVEKASLCLRLPREEEEEEEEEERVLLLSTGRGAIRTRMTSG